MSDVGSLVERLVEAGLSIGEASEIIAAAVAAGAASAVYRRSSGALRTERWRAKQRHKASQCDAQEREEISVTDRHKASQSVTSDVSSLSIEKKENQKKEKKERERASQLPPAWRPDPDVWTETVQILGSDQRAEYELKKFTDHALEKGRTAKNWNAAWRNWARRAVEYGGRNGHGNHNPRTAAVTGSPPTGSDAILAGMGRIADRIAARKLAERQDSLDLAGGDGGEPH